MSGIDLEQLLTPVEGDQPCGRDLFEDPRFYAIQQAMQGQPAREMGDSVIPAVPPDYHAAVSGCQELLRESKDVRLAVTLADALLAEQGHAGFADGLQLLRGLLERFWAHVHPVLEEGDPLNRVVAIEAFNEFKFTHRIRLAPLIGTEGYSQRDYAIALGHEQPTAADAEAGLPTPGDFQQAVSATDFATLSAAADAIRTSIEALEAIGKLMYEQGGSDAIVRLDDALAKLRLCLKPLAEAVEARGGEQAMLEAEAEVAPGGAPAAGGGPAPLALPASIQTRQQARQAIELAVRYFEAHEPSHPAPILLRRAQGLLDKPFLDVIEGLFPNDAELLGSIRKLLQLPSDES
ncbi:MAG: type VI secretion system protein TssA [Phycisphaerales bacterium]|nr:type VI secretion system protein TssA [Phycisphaerales bacterium]